MPDAYIYKKLNRITIPHEFEYISTVKKIIKYLRN